MKFKLSLCALLIALNGCSTSSTGRNQLMLISPNQLNEMGISSFEQMKEKEKISQDKATNAYVQCVADAITKNVPKSAHDGEWEVVVFDADQVNAFALPGGKIGVYTGILKVAENQQQLAAIIGHEVGHVIENHSNERLSSNQLSQAGLSLANAALESQNIAARDTLMAGLGLGVQYGILMPYGRTHESEADIVGQDLMARSGFDPKASIDLWHNMAKTSKNAPPEFLSTHPSNQTRIQDLTAHLPKALPLYNKAAAKPDCKRPRK
ncbi:M48 family metallopeptidase [Thalassomonas sp. RHCl1]|uniref:M48 family metallopeptidase n=1 Tax=Thalassomonas sp. RHCl1 TaxID=2995320 RepID=UPI00248C7F6F|nr:M48 family metallopeptidase [Thalassomonas sp. RHCl1]